MNKKGSMELSVNAIVILVIAIVMLGLILGFVKSKFSDLDNNLVSEEPAPAMASLSDPVTVSRPTLVSGSGKTVAIKISLYNGGTSMASGEMPTFDCGSNTVIAQEEFNPKDIDVGQAAVFEGLITIDTGVPKGKHLCMITGTQMTDISKDFTIEVK